MSITHGRILNEVSKKQELIRGVLRDIQGSEDQTIIGAAISQTHDLDETTLVNVTLALMETLFQDEPRQGHIFQAMTIMDYLDSLGMKVTWKNETH